MVAHSDLLLAIHLVANLAQVKAEWMVIPLVANSVHSTAEQLVGQWASKTVAVMVNYSVQSKEPLRDT